MPKLVIDVSIYLQQMISTDDNFRCFFFIAGEGLNYFGNIISIENG